MPAYSTMTLFVVHASCSSQLICKPSPTAYNTTQSDKSTLPISPVFTGGIFPCFDIMPRAASPLKYSREVKCPVFSEQSSCDSAVLVVVILFVCPSVCLSHACFVTKRKNTLTIGYFDTAWKGNHHSSCLILIPIEVAGRCSLPNEICPLKWPTPFEKTPTSTNICLLRFNRKS